MKNILLIAIIALGVNSGSAQNYQTVQLGPERNFINDTGLVRCIKIDSFTYSGNGILMMNFFTIGNGSNGCYDTTAASWIGKEIILQPDGINLILNKAGEPIFINTLAALNDSFLLYKYPNNNYLEAMVISIGIELFMWDIDSVKTFVIQAKDSNGVNMANDFNGLEFKVSKNFGFKQIYNLRDFPNDTARYIISLNRRLKWGEVYDFDIGDMFEYQNSWMHFGGLQANNQSHWIINILDKYYSSAGDTVFYVRSFDDTYSSYNGTYHSGHNAGIDTIWYTNLNDYIWDNMPEQIIIASPHLSSYNLLSQPNKYCGETYMRLIDNWTFKPHPDCYSWQPYYIYPYIENIYARALGHVKYLNDAHYGPGDVTSNGLINYFKVNQCAPSGIPIIKATIPSQLSLYPNPTSGTITIHRPLPTANCILSLTDVFGRKVYAQALTNSTEATLDISHLSNGIYFYEVAGQRGKIVKN